MCNIKHRSQIRRFPAGTPVRKRVSVPPCLLCRELGHLQTARALNHFHSFTKMRTGSERLSLKTLVCIEPNFGFLFIAWQKRILHSGNGSNRKWKTSVVEVEWYLKGQRLSVMCVFDSACLCEDVLDNFIGAILFIYLFLFYVFHTSHWVLVHLPPTQSTIPSRLNHK